MTAFRQGGNRRIDRVLDPGFLTDLTGLPMDVLRGRRREAEQEEIDHSYIRRLLQGRIDIMRAEQAWRAAGSGDDLVKQLAQVLADEDFAPAHGMGRHISLDPSQPSIHHRYFEVLLDDVHLSDVRARSDAELQDTLESFVEKERAVSTQRRAIQTVMDRCSDEIGRRYRDGEADVSSLLTGDQH